MPDPFTSVNLPSAQALAARRPVRSVIPNVADAVCDCIAAQQRVRVRGAAFTRRRRCRVLIGSSSAVGARARAVHALEGPHTARRARRSVRSLETDVADAIRDV
eukprot:2496452-Rhodomonas_salina.1